MKVSFKFYLKMVSKKPLKKLKILEWKFLMVGKTTKYKTKQFKYNIFRKTIAYKYLRKFTILYFNLTTFLPKLSEWFTTAKN